VHKVTR
jgi:hypothetical protein